MSYNQSSYSCRIFFFLIGYFFLKTKLKFVVRWLLRECYTASIARTIYLVRVTPNVVNIISFIFILFTSLYLSESSCSNFKHQIMTCIILENSYRVFHRHHQCQLIHLRHLCRLPRMTSHLLRLQWVPGGKMLSLTVHHAIIGYNCTRHQLESRHPWNFIFSPIFRTGLEIWNHDLVWSFIIMM